jgi:hypothetical protein
MAKKNDTTRYIKNMQEDNRVHWSKEKAIAILFGALITGAVTSGFAVLRLANSSYFTIIALEGRVNSIEDILVSKTEFNRFETDLNRRLDQIERTIDKL